MKAAEINCEARESDSRSCPLNPFIKIGHEFEHKANFDKFHDQNNSHYVLWPNGIKQEIKKITKKSPTAWEYKNTL